MWFQCPGHTLIPMGLVMVVGVVEVAPGLVSSSHNRLLWAYREVLAKLCQEEWYVNNRGPTTSALVP